MLSPAQVDRFHDEGFLVVPDVLDDDDLSPVIAEYEAALDRAARWMHENGHLTSAFEDLPFADRYIAIVRANPAIFYFLGISLPLDFETLPRDFVRVHTGPALFGLLTNSKLLDLAESVIGAEITLNPVQQVRLKPPQRYLSGAAAGYSNIGATTWHQDYGAVMDEAASTDLLTVWVAVTDATEDMGCLEAIPGSHREQSLTLHCPGRENPAENYIPQKLLARHDETARPLPCRKDRWSSSPNSPNMAPCSTAPIGCDGASTCDISRPASPRGVRRSHRSW